MSSLCSSSVLSIASCGCMTKLKQAKEYNQLWNFPNHIKTTNICNKLQGNVPINKDGVFWVLSRKVNFYKRLCYGLRACFSVHSNQNPVRRELQGINLIHVTYWLFKEGKINKHNIMTFESLFAQTTQEKKMEIMLTQSIMYF